MIGIPFCNDWTDFVNKDMTFKLDKFCGTSSMVSDNQ